MHGLQKLKNSRVSANRHATFYLKEYRTLIRKLRRWVKRPISIALLAKQMGASIKMIEDYYGHLDTVKRGDELSG